MTRRSVFIVAVLLAACGSTAVELANELEEVPAVLPEVDGGTSGDAGSDEPSGVEADAGGLVPVPVDDAGNTSGPTDGVPEADAGEEVDHDDCEKKCKNGHGKGDKNHCHEHKK